MPDVCAFLSSLLGPSPSPPPEAVPTRFLKPQLPHDDKKLNLKMLGQLIRARRLSPCWLPTDERSAGAAFECHICMQARVSTARGALPQRKREAAAARAQRALG